MRRDTYIPNIQLPRGWYDEDLVTITAYVTEVSADLARRGSSWYADFDDEIRASGYDNNVFDQTIERVVELVDAAGLINDSEKRLMTGVIRFVQFVAASWVSQNRRLMDALSDREYQEVTRFVDDYDRLLSRGSRDRDDRRDDRRGYGRRDDRRDDRRYDDRRGSRSSTADARSNLDNYRRSSYGARGTRDRDDRRDHGRSRNRGYERNSDSRYSDEDAKYAPVDDRRDSRRDNRRSDWEERSNDRDDKYVPRANAGVRETTSRSNQQPAPVRKEDIPESRSRIVDDNEPPARRPRYESNTGASNLFKEEIQLTLDNGHIVRALPVNCDEARQFWGPSGLPPACFSTCEVWYVLDDDNKVVETITTYKKDDTMDRTRHNTKPFFTGFAGRTPNPNNNKTMAKLNAMQQQSKIEELERQLKTKLAKAENDEERSKMLDDYEFDETFIVLNRTATIVDPNED